MNAPSLPAEAQALLAEAGKNVRQLEPQVLGEKIVDEEDAAAAWTAEATHGPADQRAGPAPGPHAGHVFVGNYLRGNTAFLVTGRKGGKAIQELHRLAAGTTKWTSGWDTGASQMLLIQSRGQSFVASPFWAAACFLWYRQ